MSRMDMDGDTLWERKDLVFPDTLFVTGQYLHSAVELPSGSIIAAGYYSSFSDTKDWGVLIKVDKNGCMDTLLCSPITSVLPAEAVTYELSIFPNPFHETINVSLSGNHNQPLQFSIHDSYGRVWKREPINTGTNNIDLNGLPPNLYFFTLKNDKGIIEKGKLMKVR